MNSKYQKQKNLRDRSKVMYYPLNVGMSKFNFPTPMYHISSIFTNISTGSFLVMSLQWCTDMEITPFSKRMYK